MKKLLTSLAVAAAISTAAHGGVVVELQYDIDNATNGADAVSGNLDFDIIDFQAWFNPLSYYIDSTQNGFVDNNEFVFDFGLNQQVVALNLGDSPVAATARTENPDGTFNLAPEGFSLVADYLLFGQAQVASVELLAATDLLRNDFEGDINNLIGAVSQTCSPAPSFLEDLCAEWQGALGVLSAPLDTTLDGDEGEFLNAAITDGIFNLFLTDADGERVGLAGSFDVTNFGASPGINAQGDLEISVNIDGTLIEAGEGILFDQFGNSFASLLGGNGLPPTLRFVTSLTLDQATKLPGTYTETPVGETNTTGNFIDDNELYYATTQVGGSQQDGFTVIDLLNTANGKCAGINNPGQIPFGGCSSIIGGDGSEFKNPEFPADNLWDTIRQQITRAAGCRRSNDDQTRGQANECDFEVLARTTTIDGFATVQTNAPGTFLIAGLGALLVGLRRKFM